MYWEADEFGNIEMTFFLQLRGFLMSIVNRMLKKIQAAIIKMSSPDQVCENVLLLGVILNC